MIMLLLIKIQLNILTGFYISYYSGYHISNIFRLTTKPSSRGPCKGIYIHASIKMHSRVVYTSLYSICYAVQHQLSKHQSSELSIIQTTTSKERSYHVLSNYCLLYRNITKPVKALQEFIHKCWF
jgi:hypothetical protein